MSLRYDAAKSLAYVAVDSLLLRACEFLHDYMHKWEMFIVASTALEYLRVCCLFPRRADFVA